MGRTSSAVRNRWNRAHYDKVYILIKKGEKEILQQAAEAEHVSVSRFIVNALNTCYPGLLAPLDDAIKPRTSTETIQEPDPEIQEHEPEELESEALEEAEEDI